jgi:hypothetical protein
MKFITFVYLLTFIIPAFGKEQIITLNCQESFSKIQSLITKIQENCGGQYDTINFLNSCKPKNDNKTTSDKIALKFDLQDCNFLEKNDNKSNSNCHKILRLSPNGGLPDLCIKPKGFYYEFSNSEKRDEMVNNFKNAMEQVGCQSSDVPSVIMVGGGRIRYTFPSSNCYLIESIPDSSSNCREGYDKVGLFPILDSKDAKGNRFVCRLKNKPTQLPSSSDVKGTK